MSPVGRLGRFFCFVIQHSPLAGAFMAVDPIDAPDQLHRTVIDIEKIRTPEIAFRVSDPPPFAKTVHLPSCERAQSTLKHLQLNAHSGRARPPELAKCYAMQFLEQICFDGFCVDCFPDLRFTKALQHVMHQTSKDWCRQFTHIVFGRPQSELVTQEVTVRALDVLTKGRNRDFRGSGRNICRTRHSESA